MDSSSPLVSIALCTYNGEKFLRKQIDSLIDQTYRPLEIVVVDDCSNDGTWKMLEEYAAVSDIFKIERNSTNLGFLRNFEKTLEKCSGEYIALCDQDDIWFAEKIEVLTSQIGGASLVYSLPSYIDENDRPIKKVFKANRVSGRCPLSLLFSNCVTGHLALIKREVLSYTLPFPKEVEWHDHWIALVSSAMGGIKAIDKPLSLYRVHGRNVSIQPRPSQGISFVNRWRSRRLRILRRMSDRLEFIRCSRSRLAELLTEKELQILDSLISCQEKLPICFFSFEQREILLKNQELLLPLYRKPGKISNRLSRGLKYYAALGYLNRN